MENPTVGVSKADTDREDCRVRGREKALKGCYLVEGELPCELGAQHDHAAHPEQQEVTACFQK